MKIRCERRGESFAVDPAQAESFEHAAAALDSGEVYAQKSQGRRAQAFSAGQLSVGKSFSSE